MADLEDPIAGLCQENGKSDECRTCITSKCNSKSTFSRCVHCDSALDPQCAINPQVERFSKMCNAYVDKCYTYISKFNVSRGCLYEKSPDSDIDECENPRKCSICDETSVFGCNNRTIVMETCVHCDTLNGENCFDNLSIFKGKVCSEIGSTDKLGCYLSVVSKNS